MSWALAYSSGRSTSEKVCGKLQLVLATAGLYLIVLFFEYWIRLGIYGFELRYTRLNRTGCNIFWGYVILTVTTLCLYLPIHLIELWVRLIIIGVYYAYDKQGRTSVDILWGYFCLGLASFGLFWVYKIIEILVRLEIEAIRFSYHLTYDKHDGYWKSFFLQVAGRILFTIFTFGLFLVFMFGEYVYRMIVNLREPPYSLDNECRRFHKLMLGGLNLIGIIVLYHYCIQGQFESSQYLLIPLCVISYPTLLIILFFSYNEGVRSLVTYVARLFILICWKISHWCDRFAQIFRYLHVRNSNYRSKIWSQFATWNSARHAYLFNVRWRRVFGNPIRVPGDAGYITPVVYTPTVHELAPVKSWETKIHERMESDQALRAQKVKNTIFTIDCTIAKLRREFAEKQLTYPSRRDLFGAQRFDQLTDLPVYGGHKAGELKKVLYAQTYQNHEILPDMEGSNQDYKVTEQYFESYLSELSELKSHTLSGYYYHLEKYIDLIPQHVDQIQVEIINHPVPIEPIIEIQPGIEGLPQAGIEGLPQPVEVRASVSRDSSPSMVHFIDESDKEPGLSSSYQNDEKV